MGGSECSGGWGWRTKGGSPLEERQCISRLEPYLEPLLGIEAAPCLFGRGVL